jgi:nucleoside 2-deoxyribosyltransferase
LCSSLRNRELNSDLVNYLNNDYEIYVPQLHTPQENGTSIFTANITGIREAKVILVVLENYYGIDLAWEAGYAFGLNKIILGYYEKYQASKTNHEMLDESFTHVVIGREELSDILRKYAI